MISAGTEKPRSMSTMMMTAKANPKEPTRTG